MLCLALASGLAPRPAAGQPAPQENQRGGDVYMFVRYDIGMASSGVPQNLPADWPTRFQPPSGSMTTSGSDDAWFGEVGLGVAPRWNLGKGEIALPIFYNFFGLSSLQKRFYSTRRPVAGTELDWSNPVRLHATAVQKTSPEIGVAYSRGWITIHPSVQTYRLFAEDYVGDGGSSSLHTITNLGSGLGQRIDVRVRSNPLDILGLRFDPWNVGSVGFFYERNGGDAWQVGVSVTVGMELKSLRRGKR